ncbi:hypothetical protein cypCar_00014130 [Cyprinus carpio]|nr:hypothetical protein cypCar_00014130 [Cyprinus carpio]
MLSFKALPNPRWGGEVWMGQSNTSQSFTFEHYRLAPSQPSTSTVKELPATQTIEFIQRFSEVAGSGPHAVMLSLDEPLDLKVPRGRVSGRDRGARSPPTLTPSPIHAKGAGQLRMADDGTAVIVPASPASPHTGVLQAKSETPTPPAVDLSLSPSSRNTACSPDLANGNGSAPIFPGDSAHIRYVEGGATSQAFQFFLPIGGGGGLHLPSSMFIRQPKDTRASPDLSADEQLACRWRRCHLLFDSLQDLVDHVNDFHVKPEKESGYCCHWEGCARKGRGFNARYKWRNTGEKPYICPYEGCNKRYSNSSDRFKHTRTHYVDKPYYCKMVGCLKRYTDPSSLRKHIKAHGHFVAQEQGGPGGVGSLMKPGQIAGAGKESELTYVSGAHFIIPGAAAALLGGHGLQGLGGSLPLSPLNHHPLDLSTLGCPSSPPAGLGKASILSFNGSPLGLAKSPLLSHTFSSSTLGLPMVPILGSERRDHGKGKARGDEGEDEIHGGVLNLSTGASHDPLSWVVIPSGPVVLKPAVVN